MSDRRKFLYGLSALLLNGSLPINFELNLIREKKLKVALVGTGIRGIGFWGKRLVDQYGDLLEFVGLSDINPGRLQLARQTMEVDCPVFIDFDSMLPATNPDLLIVTTVDSTHHEFIVKGLDFGCDVLTEKPMTTDEEKCRAILKAEQRSGRKLIVGFNYRWTPYATRIKSLLKEEPIGRVTSVDFHWYLNNYHGASYFRRWHGQREYGGTLLVHKATHHFDLLNWWLDSDPFEVFAYGSLEHYGHNGSFRGSHCRSCQHSGSCEYYWDIMKDTNSVKLYVENEQYDGYIRDNCLFREEIDIYDKMSVQIKYANDSVVNYSLTTYSPFEGWRIAFNGQKGRVEAWQDIPYYDNMDMSQEELHTAEMSQGVEEGVVSQPLIIHSNFDDYKVLRVVQDRAGHGGGDRRLQDSIFNAAAKGEDDLGHFAGVRDGAMSILIGIAARKSIEAGRPVRIDELTDLVPRAQRI